MATFGISDEGVPEFSLKRLENGFVIPDVSVSDIHRIHQRQITQQIERGVLAERLGYDYVVHPEHHFSLIGSISPNPVVSQTAIATRTEDVRLLQMANILPWHEPLRLAEQTAMLDLISDGRTEVGIGRGFGAREAETLGQYWGGTSKNQAQNQEAFGEAYEILRAAWTEEFVSHHGQFHDIPPTYTEWDHDQEYHYLADDVSGHDPEEYMEVGLGSTILQSIPVFPWPKQKPHPQIWKPAGSPSSTRWAAQNGINACFHCGAFTDASDMIEDYHTAAEEAGWPDPRSEHDGEPFHRGWDAERRRGIVGIMSIYNTDIMGERALDRLKLATEFSQSRTKARRPPEAADSVEIDGEKYLSELTEAEAPLIGSTEEILDQLASYFEQTEYKDPAVFIDVHIPGMTHDEAVMQLQSFAEDIMPYFTE